MISFHVANNDVISDFAFSSNGWYNSSFHNLVIVGGHFVKKSDLRSSDIYGKYEFAVILSSLKSKKRVIRSVTLTKSNYRFLKILNITAYSLFS